MSEIVLTVYVYGAGTGSLRGAVVYLDSQAQGQGPANYVQFTIYSGVDYYIRTELAGWKTNIRVMGARTVNTSLQITLCSPNGDYVEVYRDLDIIYDNGTGFYYTRYYEKFFDTLTSVEEARLRIDEWLGFAVPVPAGGGGGMTGTGGGGGTPTPTPAPVGGTPVVIAPSNITLPSYLWWLQGVFDWVEGVFTGIGNAITGALSGGFKTLEDAAKTNYDLQQKGLEKIDTSLSQTKDAPNLLVSGFMSAFKGVTDSLTKPLSDFGSTASKEVMDAASAHSPDPKLKAQVDELIKQYTEAQRRIIDEVHKSPANPEQAPGTSATLAATLLGVQLSVEVAGALIDILHPVKMVGAARIAERVVDNLAVGNTIGDIIGMPTQIGLIPPLMHYYNSIYQPNIPGYSDLQNMRMKEIIGQNEFEKDLSYQGFASDWAKKLWSAHYAPPSLTDIITAYRRGVPVQYPKSDPASGEIIWVGPKVLDLNDVQYLLESIDLDPRYKEIFLTRIYNDVPISYARWMYETGAIKTREEVLTIVRKQGIDPTYENNVVDMVIGFAVRTYRHRYWMALQMALTKGAITEADVKAGVADNPQDATIDYWMIKTANMRKLIASKTTSATGVKLLALGDLKKAYANNLMTEDTLRTELQLRGYATTEIETLIEIMDLDKAEVEGGKRVVALSVSEMLNAYRYGVWTEDKVRIELTLRGLSQEEVNTIIDTKKAMWGVASQQTG